MDESWNFLKEAPESELALVQKAGNISCSVSIEAMVSSILLPYGLGKNDSYEEFLDKICKELSMNIGSLDVENKELELLKLFLFQGIEKMDENQIVRFASNYNFSNLNKEKLINEIEVRIKTSDRFQTILYQIVPAIFGMDFSRVFPSDTTELDILVGCNRIDCVMLVSTLIFLRYQHERVYDDNYVSRYLNKIIESNIVFDNRKDAILSAMLCFAKRIIENDVRKYDIIIKDIYSFLGNKNLEVPCYFLNKTCDDNGGVYVVEYLMGLLFPCNENEQGCYDIMNNEIKKYHSMAFFEYRFPYTIISKQTESLYLMPNDEFDRYSVMLYLLCHDIDPSSHLFSKAELIKKKLDCAAIPINSTSLDYPTFSCHIQPEDPHVYGFKCFIQKIGTIDGNSRNIIKALKEFIQLNHGTMLKLAKVIDNQTHVLGQIEEIKELIHMLCSLRKCNL